MPIAFSTKTQNSSSAFISSSSPLFLSLRIIFFISFLALFPFWHWESRCWTLATIEETLGKQVGRKEHQQPAGGRWQEEKENVIEKDLRIH